jgi:hypothetical protein
MHLLLINIETTLSASIKLASYKTNYFVVLIRWLSSSGSVYICEDINVNNNITLNICIL